MIRLASFGYTYPGMRRPAVEGVRAHVPSGATVLVSGPSGSGKSTLLRALNGLVPHFTGGCVRGALAVAGLDPVSAGPGVMSAVVGHVPGDPEASLIADTVVDEVAFALEEQGVPPTTIRQRVAGALDAVGLLELAQRPIETLSGGERQRTAIAAALALAPQVLVLDEPTSQLDDAAAADVLAAVANLAREGRLTVMLSEHRRQRVLTHVTHELSFERPGEPPSFVAGPAADGGREPPVSRQARAPGEVRLRVEGVRFGYGGASVFADASFAVYSGEVVALTGPSGSGKTTLLRLISGLLRPETGWIEVAGRPAGRWLRGVRPGVGYLPQDPGALLFAETVRDEVAASLVRRGDGRFAPRAVWALLDALGLADVADRYPRDLSTGQRQRVALAAVVVGRPAVLLLDEPTRGLDDGAIFRLGQLLDRLAAEGAAILLATHDRRLVRWADRALALVPDGQAAGVTVRNVSLPA